MICLICLFNKILFKYKYNKETNKQADFTVTLYYNIIEQYVVILYH